MNQLIFFKSIVIILLIVLISASNLQAAGVTMITHGYQMEPESPEWLEYMLHAVGEENISGSWSRYTVVIDSPAWGELRATVEQDGASPANTDSGEILIELDWSQVAGGILGLPNYSTSDIAEKVVANLINSSAFPGLKTPIIELPIHLIGHSRGGVLMTQIAELLGQHGIWVNQLTTLDPVPLPIDTLGSAFPMRLRENVIFADNYIQALSISTLNGSRLAGSFPRPAWDDPAELAGGYLIAHFDVHLWYHGTIDLQTPLSDGTSPDAQTITTAMRNSSGWWSSSERKGAQAGFYYSRILGGTYSGGTRSGIGFTPPTNPHREAWNITARGAGVWDNVEIAAITANDIVYPGDSIQVATWFYDLNNDATITWGLDFGNENPYRSSNKIELASLSTSSIPFGTGESLTTARYLSQMIDIIGVTPGSYCLYAKINNGTRTRYYYHNCDDSGTLDVECRVNADCDDGLYCTGFETCTQGSCFSQGDPCATGSASVCDEEADSCIECQFNTDCDNGQFCDGMEICDSGVCRLGGLPCGDTFCDETINVCQTCIEDDDCFGGVCVDSVCFDCQDDTDCNDALYCTGSETCTQGVCLSFGDPCATNISPVCDEENKSCVECLINADCEALSLCEDSACVPICPLFIKYKFLLAEKLKKPKKLKLTITGKEGFDPYGTVEVGQLEVLKTKINAKKGRLKIKVLVPAGYPKGTVAVRVGGCIGEIDIL